MPETNPKDPLLYGAAGEPGLVAIERDEADAAGDGMILYTREGRDVVTCREPFEPWLFVEAARMQGCPVAARLEPLQGTGPLNALARFARWRDYQKAVAWLAETTGRSAGERGAPYYGANDPVQQFLMATGRTSFLGMQFEDLRRLQVDIECITSPGYEFCNAEREGDRIVAIGLADSTGWSDVLAGEEPALLKAFVDRVAERDPDVIEGHNIFNFDLPYLWTRAAHHGIALRLGRDGSSPRRRPSQFNIGDRTLAYERFDIAGRHVVDTLFLAHAYDISHRSLGGFGLKEVAVHFGLAAPDRTYVEGGAVTETFRSDPARLLRYLADDVRETGALSGLLSRSSFVQAQMLPYSYQNICVRGNAAKIDALMIREYLRTRQALPMPGPAKDYEGGYTDLFVRGVVRNVHHCDVRSLYPSLMLQGRLAPRSDPAGVFLRLLDSLRTMRLTAKARAKAGDAAYYEALQATLKILINSFYGYLGFSQARFGDFERAEQVTAQGRELLRSMVEWIRANGGLPVEIDTDGIYFVPPAAAGAGLEDFRRRFAASLPAGIEIEFDGEYVAMFSYKMKNYALLDSAGGVTIKGAALKSRGLEPFQRQFLETVIRLKLEEKETGIAALRDEYAAAIREGRWPIAMLAKTERLQDSPASYSTKIAKGKRARNALYELVLRSGREFRAGDQLSYYVTGTKKSVAVHEAARLVSEWDPSARDENVAYYLDKLDSLYEKLTEPEEEQPSAAGAPRGRKRKGSGT